MKLLGYRFLDRGKADEANPVARVTSPAKAGQPKPEEKASPVLETKAEQPKPEAKTNQPEPEEKASAATEAKAEPEAQTKASSNLTSQIAGRAYELFEHRAPNDGTAVQDWKKAEQEIRNDEAKGEPKVEAKAEPKPEAKADASKPESETESTPQSKADAPTPEAKTENPKPQAKDKPQPDATPQLVKRVHELYEELGREDVQSVQDWEKAHPELEEHEAHK